MLLLGSDILTRFLNRAAGTPFEWGRFDCLLWLADLIVEQRGIDPAAELRGTYATLLSAAKIVKQAGGMMALVDARVRGFNIAKTKTPQRGDIVVVPVAGLGVQPFDGLAGGILLGGTVALLCQDGVLFNKLEESPPVAAWRV